jgi:hypothetical protein
VALAIVAADFPQKASSRRPSRYFPSRPGSSSRPCRAVERVLPALLSAKKLIVDHRLECGYADEEREKGKPANQGLGDVHPSQCHRCNNCVGGQYACDDAKMFFWHQKIDQITAPTVISTPSPMDCPGLMQCTRPLRGIGVSAWWRALKPRQPAKASKRHKALPRNGHRRLPSALALRVAPSRYGPLTVGRSGKTAIYRCSGRHARGAARLAEPWSLKTFGGCLGDPPLHDLGYGWPRPIGHAHAWLVRSFDFWFPSVRQSLSRTLPLR